MPLALYCGTGGGCIGCEATASFLLPDGSLDDVKAEFGKFKVWDARASFGDIQDAGIDIRLTSEVAPPWTGLLLVGFGASLCIS